jgi:hypothetical protein
MEMLPPAEFSRRAFIGLAMILAAGCACDKPSPPQPGYPPCPSNFSQHYIDTARHFSLCLPASATESNNTGGYPSGTVLFNGFAVPPGTNLEQKRLIIVPGTDPNMQGATPYGHFTADGVTFTRSQELDGSAGHMTTNIIYTWTQGGNTLDFDFSLYAVNPGVYPPSEQPAEYDLAAQVRFTEKIMGTFHRLH